MRSSHNVLKKKFARSRNQKARNYAGSRAFIARSCRTMLDVQSFPLYYKLANKYYENQGFGLLHNSNAMKNAMHAIKISRGGTCLSRGKGDRQLSLQDGQLIRVTITNNLSQQLLSIGRISLEKLCHCLIIVIEIELLGREWSPDAHGFWCDSAHSCFAAAVRPYRPQGRNRIAN